MILPEKATSPSARGPIVSLLLLAPLISELLYGAVRISTIFVYFLEITTWGCGALLIRECVCRLRKGWQSMLLLGLALAVAEEWVIQQTSIAPLVGLAQHAYGRFIGVNWVYFLWAAGYESVWVVLAPVLLTELLFPAQRQQAWLRTRGLVITSVVFVIGAIMAWYGWTQQARVTIFHMPPYSPPPMYLLIGCIAILFLAGLAFALPVSKPASASRLAPPPTLVGLNTWIMGTPWAAFVLLAYGALPNVPVSLALIGGLAWSGVTFFLVQQWTSSANWNDSHRFALVFGATLACMTGGFVVFASGGALPIDWIGKAILNAGAVVWLLWLGRKITQRQ